MMKILVLLITAGIFGIAALSLKTLGRQKKEESQDGSGCTGNCASCHSSCHSDFVKKD